MRRTRLRPSFLRQFESLEARQMLNAAPVANDDVYVVAEDGVLSNVSSLPANMNVVQSGDNGHYYAHVPTVTTSWQGAEATAAGMRYRGSPGHLVTVTSAAEETFILSNVINHLPRDSRVYAGLTDRDSEGDWKWVTGESATYTHWNPGEPTPGQNNEDFMAMFHFSSGWLWGDIPDDGRFAGSSIVEFDGPFTNSLLANDTDADNDTLTTVLVSGPENGTLDFEANGIFTYTPNADFAGTDSFTYKANDGQLDSDIATVTITVTPNAAPVAKNDTYTVAEDTVVRVGENNLPAGVVPQRWSDNGHYYALITDRLNAPDAFAAAAAFNFQGSPGHLVTFSSAAEQDFLFTAFPWPVTRTIGLSDVEQEGVFRWVTGEPLTYTAWYPGEPNNSGNAEDYVELRGDRLWNDNNAIEPREYIVEFDGPFVDPILANDTDTEGDPLKSILVAGPEYGTLTLDEKGTFTYAPNPNFVGADTFTYKVNDGDQDSNVATVTINVAPVNDTPVANPERYVTAQNQAMTVAAAEGVIANDTDVDGDALTAALVTGPSKGQLTLNADGSFTYTPTTGYFGPDSFTYQVSDSKAISEPTTVKLFVTNPNNVAPLAQDDSYTTPEDTVLLGQSPLPGNILPRRWSENGHYYAHVTSATHWLDAEAAAAKMTYLGATGHLVTIASAGEEAFLTSSFLSNWVANPVFIGLTDRAVEGDFRWISGEPVTYTNWTPGEPNNFGSGQDYAQLVRHADGRWQWDDVWSAPHFGSYLVEFDGPFKGGALVNDSDANNDTLSAVLVTPPQHGTVALNEDGTFEYTPNPNYNGPDSFTYKANDGELDSNIATVNITVQAVNDAPTAVPDKYTVAEDTELKVAVGQGVLTNDSDPEGDSFTAVLAVAPQNGQVTFNTDGSFTYRPNQNFVGLDTFTYRARDNAEGQPATVTIEVTNVNDAPVAVNDTVTVNEDTPLTFTGLPPAGFTPTLWTVNGHYYAQLGDRLSWHAASSAAQSLRHRGAAGHLVTVNSKAEHDFLVNTLLPGQRFKRLWIGLTDEGDEGNFRWVTGESLTFTNWGGGQPDNARNEEHYAEMVHVGDTQGWLWNDIYPSFGNDGYLVEFEGPFRQGVLENDQDIDNDPLSAQLVAGPTNGSLTFNTNGTFTYTPNPNFSGTDSFGYKASDGELDSNVAKVTLNVLPANDPPVAVADNYFVADTLTVSASNGVLANDTDIDSPTASFTAQLITPPANGTLILHPDGSFTYTRGLSFTGSDTFTYRTSDGSALSEPTTVTITAALRLRTESITIVSQPLAPVEGFFDVYVDVAPGFEFSAAGYDVALRTAPGSGITLVSASAPSAAHPSLFATEPTFVVAGGTLRVTDVLAMGAADLDNGDGLFRVRFTVAPETVGNVPLLFTTAFTNLADENGDPLPIARIGGTIAVSEPPAPQVGGVFVRSIEWTSEFVAALQAQGAGYAIPAGSGQLADLPWINVDQIVVRFNEHVGVQQEDLVVHGVNNQSYATIGFAYDPASFTATWTLEDPLPADKVLVQLIADGADPIRNAAGVRLDGDWSNGTGAFPSGNGRSGGDFLFRMNVLPGNVDQTGPVNIFDTIKTRNRQFTSVGHANYDARYDVNGSGEINIFDAVQVRNHQFTSLPEGEPVAVAPSPPAGLTIAAAPPAVRIRTDNIVIASQTDTAVEGVFDVFVDVTEGAEVSIAGYDVALLTPPPGSGVALVSAGIASDVHPAVFSSEPTDFASPELLGITDALPTGAAPLTHSAGLFSVRFTVAPGAAGSVPLMFHTSFTNLADGSGSPVAVDLEPGTITIIPPPTTITGTDGDDQYHVLRSGSQILIYENTPPTGEPTYTVDLSANTLIIDAGDGDDSLTVDPGAQAALGLHRLVYTAGTGNNTLELAGGSARIDSTALGGTLNTTVNAGAQLSTARLKQNGLSLEDNSRVTLLLDSDTSVITSLMLGTGATLDIGDNAIVIDYAGASPVAAIREQIIAGRGTTGLGATWTGTGITSSAAAASNATEPEARSVGYAENAALPLGPYTTFRGQPVDDTAIVIAYVRTGDANLDGVVNDSDVTIVSATYAPAAPNSSWALGDFDFDGFIDDDDVTFLGVFYEPAASVPAQAPSELIDLLAESLHVKNGAQAASLTDHNQIVGRKSHALDSFWSSWNS